MLSTDFFLHIYDHLFITLIALLKEEYNRHTKTMPTAFVHEQIILIIFENHHHIVLD